MIERFNSIGAGALLAIGMALVPANCSGKFTIQDHKQGCVHLKGGDVSWKFSGGVLTLNGGGAAITVDQSDDPACVECAITGKVRVWIDANGNGVLDPGEDEWTSDVNDTGPGNGEITIGGTTINGASEATKVVVEYDLVDCHGNRISRTQKYSR